MDLTRFNIIYRYLKKGVQIKAVITDIDGVLTDGGMYYSESGDELKRFCVYDGMGLKLFQRSGCKVAIITSEERALNEMRSSKLKLDKIVQGKWNKLEHAEEMLKKWGISLEETLFVGDEINDKALLQQVGFPVCPSNAHREIKNIPNIFQTNSAGGSGVLREIFDVAERYHLVEPPQL